MPTNTIRPDTRLAIAGLQERLKAAPKIQVHEWNRGHYYAVEGHLNPDHKKGWWPSVTSILSAGVPKPALVGWAKRTTLEAVREAMLATYPKITYSYESFVDGVIEAAKAREDTEARDYGTAAHALISDYVLTGTIAGSEALGYESLRAFRDWLLASGLTVAASEFPVFHEGIAGTVDLLLYDGFGAWTLADIKTGAGAYQEYAFQTAAYQYAASKMLDINIQQAAIIHLPKNPKEGEPPFAAYRVKDSAVALVGYHAAAAMRATLSMKHLEPLTAAEQEPK